MSVRTRFAPSPTGYIHIGNVRSAIYPYLIAKQNGGQFILRIEDTDRARYMEGATELIEDTLKWLGLNWDEGVEVGGPDGPYFQSERAEIYLEWAKKLIEKGRAYVDTTPAEVVDAYRQEDNAKKQAFLYRNHRPESAEWSTEQTLAAFQPGVPLRFKAEPKEYTWHDEVMGEMHTGPEVCDDIILIKKDGLPTYNFAHIIDDYTMRVSHIARGVEYLSSMPNYLALYEALEIEHPKFLSLPHILAPQGNKKLGKRDGAKSVTEYRDDGILPEAMLNYLACLGWNDGTEQEVYTHDELIQAFSVERIQSSPARFDNNKILWYNGIWIRKIADEQGTEALYSYTEGFWPEAAKSEPKDYRLKVLGIIYDRLKTLGDLREMTSYFFSDPRVDLEFLKSSKPLKKLSEQELADLLTLSAQTLQNVSEEDWQENNLQEVLNDLLAASGRKPAEIFSLIRVAVSFAPFSPALNLTLAVLGRERTLARIASVRNALAQD